MPCTVSMHLLVLSAFRLGRQRMVHPLRHIVSMHLLVLSAFRLKGVEKRMSKDYMKSQCTFWCSVLSDLKTPSSKSRLTPSQCTFWCSVLSDLKDTLSCMLHSLCLNAPSGAQRFPTNRKEAL